jgi:hypothetical protein
MTWESLLANHSIHVFHFQMIAGYLFIPSARVEQAVQDAKQFLQEMEASWVWLSHFMGASLFELGVFVCWNFMIIIVVEFCLSVFSCFFSYVCIEFQKKAPPCRTFKCPQESEQQRAATLESSIDLVGVDVAGFKHDRYI